MRRPRLGRRGEGVDRWRKKPKNMQKKRRIETERSKDIRTQAPLRLIQK